MFKWFKYGCNFFCIAWSIVKFFAGLPVDLNHIKSSVQFILLLCLFYCSIVYFRNKHCSDWFFTNMVLKWSKKLHNICGVHFPTKSPTPRRETRRRENYVISICFCVTRNEEYVSLIRLFIWEYEWSNEIYAQSWVIWKIKEISWLSLTMHLLTLIFTKKIIKYIVSF